LRAFLGDDDEGDVSRWEGWSFAPITGAQPAVELFEPALAAGDVLLAWALLNRPGWAHDEAHAAWKQIAPHVDPRLRSVTEAKLASFPIDDGY
jgi:hypothetical protein